MKKITWLTFICTALLGILLLCCTNGLSPDSSVKGDGVEVGDQLTISIHADENLEIFSKPAANSKSRTISSEAFSIETGAGLYYYLSGEATNGSILEPRTVDVTSDDGITGTVTLDIDCYNWQLTLAAVEEELDFTDATDYASKCASVKNNAVLIGSATVDMVFTNSIDFTLSPKGLTKLGSVALAIAREGDWAIPEGYTVTAGIYDLVTRDPVSLFEESGAAYTGGTNIQTLTDSADATAAPEKGKFVPAAFDTAHFDADEATYTANDKFINPGTYLFEIQIRKAGENRAYVWNDTIIILPGKQSNMLNVLNSTTSAREKKKLIIVPNLIGVIPDDPATLTVTCSDPDVDASGYYSAEFTWTAPDVVTETNFALEIIELKDTQTISETDEVNDTTWDALKADAESSYIFDYLNDIRKDLRFYKEGSLFANNTSVTLLLELGKRYLARLRAENNAGYSANAAYVQVVDATDASVFHYKGINKYRVTYHLQGGTWDTSDAAGPTIDQVEYGDFSTDYSVLAPRGITNPDLTDNPAAPPVIGDTDHPFLHDGAAKWAYWTEGLNGEKYPGGSTDTYTPEAYTGYKNLDLYAKYSREGGVTVYDDNDYDIFQNYLSGLQQDDDDTDIIKEGKITFSKAHAQTNAEGAKYTEVSLTLPDNTETWKYDKVIFEVTYGGRTYVADEQVGAARGEANTFSFLLTNFQTGYVYNCKITAHYQRTVVSYPFALYLTD